MNDLHAGECQAAVRALLRQPVMAVDHPRFPLVRRHADWLRQFFVDETGWVLTVDRDVARLRKHPPATIDASRPATDRQATPFTRRRYVLLCLALAVIERGETQATLGWLADQLLAEAADTELNISFDLGHREQRSDLVAIVRLLIDLQVISRVAGDEQAYIDATGDALYDVNRRVLGRLLSADRGPSTITAPDFAHRFAELIDRPVVDAPQARLWASRRELGRRLLDDPIVYTEDLDPDEIEYLRTQRVAVLRRLVEATGMQPEVRAEGLALLDPTGEATDVGLPEDGTDGHVTLLVAEFLSGHAADVPAEVGTDRVRTHVIALISTHGKRWRKQAREAGAERHLTHVALERLAQLGLIEQHGDVIRVRPAIHRFAAAEPTIGGRAAVQDTLA